MSNFLKKKKYFINAVWLEETLSQNPVPKLVTVVNPGNPSGAFIPELVLQVRHAYVAEYVFSVYFLQDCCQFVFEDNSF